MGIPLLASSLAIAQVRSSILSKVTESGHGGTAYRQKQSGSESMLFITKLLYSPASAIGLMFVGVKGIRFPVAETI